MPADLIKREGDEYIIPDTDNETVITQIKHIENCVNAIVFFATDHTETFVSGAILPVPDDGVVNMLTV